MQLKIKQRKHNTQTTKSKTPHNRNEQLKTEHTTFKISILKCNNYTITNKKIFSQRTTNNKQLTAFN